MNATLRVVTLNVGSLVEPDWKNRRHEIVSWLDHLRPDVVCLQEVWEAPGKKNTARWIADESATDWHLAVGVRPFGAAVRDDPGLLFGSAILSRWPIDTQHYEPLGLDPQHADPFLSAIPWELLHVSTPEWNASSLIDVGAVRRVAAEALDVVDTPFLRAFSMAI